jgi:hypothetical protein
MTTADAIHEQTEVLRDIGSKLEKIVMAICHGGQSLKEISTNIESMQVSTAEIANAQTALAEIEYAELDEE